MTKRQPKGTPVGGQFAPDRKSASEDLTTSALSMTEDHDGTKEWYRNGKPVSPPKGDNP